MGFLLVSRALARGLLSRKVAQSGSLVGDLSVRMCRGLSTSSTGKPKRPWDEDNKTLGDFLAESQGDVLTTTPGESVETMQPAGVYPAEHDAETTVASDKTYFIETYGCQMNVNDTEIVHSILQDAGFKLGTSLEDSSYLLVNTCAIREKAEQTVWHRLDHFKALKRATRDKQTKKYNRVVGVLGCMAERLKSKLIESDKLVDVVVGPDAYRDLPRLLSAADEGSTAVNTILSLDETYRDITPVRESSNNVSAFVSIMRGCDNMCSFCIVPFTRGRERSRDVDSILSEVQLLSDQGYKEVTLLGQNVNSYNYVTPEDRNAPLPVTREAKSVGFTNISRRPDTGVDFTELIERVGAVNPNMRVRFTSPHPKDFPMDLIEVIKNNPNICNNLHMPLQSGSTDVLKSMRRGYTQEAYLQLVQAVRERIPDITISTDIIAGFCGETDQDHKETIYTMQQVGYDVAYMFKYSQRAKTHAHRKMEDDVPEKVKGARLTEIIKQFQGQHREKLHTYKGSTQLVLVDGHSVKHPDQLVGRTDGNKRVIFPDMPLPVYGSEAPAQAVQMGDYVVVKVVNTEKALRGEPSYIADVPSFAANAELHQ